MKLQVTVVLPDDRFATCEGRALVLAAGTALSGELTLEPSDGPLGIREYEHPHCLATTLDFFFDGRCLRYANWVSGRNLWLPSGTQVQTECADFVNQVGPIDGMMDDRDDWFYVLPDGRIHRNRLKYTACNFQLMAQPSSLLVRCQYYDQNPGIAGMVAIFYSRPLEELLFLKDTQVFYDSHGKIADFFLHGGDTIMLNPA